MDGILFIARLGSTRLSQKHLIEVKGKTFIEWLVVRFMTQFREQIANGAIKLILLTADEPENRRFEKVLDGYPITVFYGSPENIPLRLLQCCDHFNFTNIISVDGDDILCTTEGSEKIWKKIQGENEQVMIKTVGLPLGMNVMALSRDLLSGKRDRIGTGKLETGWGWVFEDARLIEIEEGDFSSDQNLRFTLDYDEDAQFFKAIIEGMDVVDSAAREIVSYVVQNRLYEINQHLNEQYWNNFNQQRSKEQS